ncbi:MAG TPA: hypothetical protein VF714_07680 [Jatrophihabitans sp.]|jgi:hypothetical protein
MMLLVLGLTVTGGLAAVATAMAVKGWGLTGAAAVGSALSGSSVQLMLDRHRRPEHLFDDWIDTIGYDDALVTRSAS